MSVWLVFVIGNLTDSKSALDAVTSID